MPVNPIPPPDLAQFCYKPDEEPKRKHKRDQPVAGFVKLRDKVVGKCPCTMSLAEAEALMREGFVVLTDNPWPKRIYAVGRDGVLYRFTETVAGQSYHGFPAHGAKYRLDPDRFLIELGVSIEDCTLESANVDAIAVWGPKHGPAVFINRAGTHAKDDKGRRTTLAHELCHLLLDREGALPLAEVLGGAAPPGVERRARVRCRVPGAQGGCGPRLVCGHLVRAGV